MPSVPKPFRTITVSHDGSTRVAAHGELDLSSVDVLRGALDEAVRLGGREIVLDLSGLTFIDSTGLHLLIERDAAACRAGYAFAVAVDGSVSVRRILQVAGLSEHFKVD